MASFRASTRARARISECGTKRSLDPALVEILNADVDRYVADGTFRISNSTAEQLALAVTGGYRAKFALGEASRRQP